MGSAVLTLFYTLYDVSMLLASPMIVEAYKLRAQQCHGSYSAKPLEKRFDF